MTTLSKICFRLNPKIRQSVAIQSTTIITKKYAINVLYKSVCYIQVTLQQEILIIYLLPISRNMRNNTSGCQLVPIHKCTIFTTYLHNKTYLEHYSPQLHIIKFHTKRKHHNKRNAPSATN